MSDQPNCYQCRHRRDVPGDAHSACHHPATRSLREGGGISEIIGILGKRSGFTSLDLPASARALGVSGDPVAEARGWFLWPLNFDPRWLRSCLGFERKPAP